MRKASRIALRILGGLVALILLVAVGSYVISNARLRKHYEVAGKAVPVPTDSVSLVRGKALATLFGCTSCHASDLGGQKMVDRFPIARLASSNLTRGQGGIGGMYKDRDWDRAVRHGIRWDGSPLFLMPAHIFNRISDDEFGRLLAYVKSVPPVDRTPESRAIYPVVATVHVFGAPLVPAEKIDHTTQRNPQPPPGATMAYGEYLSVACKICHGEDLGGQKDGGRPGAPPSPPIGPKSVVAHWTDAQFIQTMHTGVTPEGRTLRSQYMPWPAVGTLSDDEMKGVLMYLKKGP